MSAKHLIAPVLLVVLASAGCGTMGGNQVENAVFATHRTVTNLDKSLEPSVNKLNENVAGLLARMDESDQQVKALQSTVEENTVKLNSIEKKVDALTKAVYRMLGRSGGASVPVGPNAPGVGGEVVVTPPPQSGAGGVLPPPSPAPEGGAVPPQPIAPPVVPPTPGIPPAPATAAGSGDAEADYQAAQRSYASENYAAALDQFNAFLQRYPTSQNSPNAQFWKAKSLQNLDKNEDAIAEFTKLRTSYPTSVRVPYAMLYEALCHKKLGQTDRAVALMKEVVQNYPMTPAADQARTELQRAKQ